MNVFMLAGGGFFFLISSIVGFRLLLLAWKHRTAPELILGVAFVVGGTIGGALGQILQTQGTRFDPEWLGPAQLLYGFIATTGITAYNAFTWRVFQPKTGWAKALVLSILAASIAQMLWRAQSGVYATGEILPAQRVAETLLYSIGPAWAMIEAIKYYAQIRRRLLLGLADEVIVNRIGLWGIGSAFATIIVLSSILLVIFEPGHPMVRLNAAIIGMCGSAASIAYWLAFFPPRSYLDWVRGEVADEITD